MNKLKTINLRLRQLYKGGASSSPLFLELHAEQFALLEEKENITLNKDIGVSPHIKKKGFKWLT